MTDRNTKKRIQNSMDHALSGLPTDSFLTQRVLKRATQTKGEEKMKKKLSGSLIFAIILTLIIATAAAAILSNRDFVDQIVAPIAENKSDINWSSEEVDEIIRLADKNGISIYEETINRLKSPEERNKAETMRSIVSTELGPYIATWSIEDQAWFDELLVRSKLSSQQTRFVPAEGEVSETAAIDIATKHIESEFNAKLTGSESESYVLFKEYRQFIDENNNIQPRKWFFHFEPENHTLDTFDVVISAQGEVLDAIRESGIKSISDVASTEAVFDYYAAEYGMHYEWTQKVWESFQADLQRSVEKHGHQTNFTAYALKQKYGNPQTSPMSEQIATDAAYKATAQSSGIDEVELRQKYKANALLLMGKDGLVWKVTLVNANPGGRQVFDLWSAEVNVGTGEVTNVVHYEPGKNSIYDAYYLIEILTDVSDWPANG